MSSIFYTLVYICETTKILTVVTHYYKCSAFLSLPHSEKYSWSDLSMADDAAEGNVPWSLQEFIFQVVE